MSPHSATRRSFHSTRPNSSRSSKEGLLRPHRVQTQLQRRGFLIAPRWIPVPRTLSGCLLPELDDLGDKAGTRKWRLFDARGWLKPPVLSPETRGRTLRFLERATRSLERKFPREGFHLGTVELRRTLRDRCPIAHPHIDGGYLTLTLALSGPGTVFYEKRRGRTAVTETATGAVAVCSNRDREIATGGRAAVHSAPTGRVEERVMLIVIYRRSGSSSPRKYAAEIRDRMKLREKSFSDKSPALNGRESARFRPSSASGAASG